LPRRTKNYCLLKQEGKRRERNNSGTTRKEKEWQLKKDEKGQRKFLDNYE